MTVQNPHDRFFRESFGRIEVARNYLEEYLPANQFVRAARYF
ncbi:MAG: Rpn family recombination-promoting nuclease/putative transposase [Anaerolinea sp.]|nr:Rpn family recombination-promoting nuclease/putative transposase [Anaerolinea sp.]